MSSAYIMTCMVDVMIPSGQVMEAHLGTALYPEMHHACWQ